MVDFTNVASAAVVPNTGGFRLGVGEVPATVFFSNLGNWGTGNPVGQLYVLRTDGGTWVPVKNATVTDNGTLIAHIFGTRTRYLVPTLTSPGTGATAPRVAYSIDRAQPIISQESGDIVANHSHFIEDGEGDGTYLETAGFGHINPNIDPINALSKSRATLTLIGTDGVAYIEGLYRDGDGAFWIKESDSITANGQITVESHAEAYRVNLDVTAGGDEVFLDVIKLNA